MRSKRVGAAEHVEDHRVVDDHLGGGQRVDLVGVAAEVGDGLTHGGEVDDAGHAGEVLHDHAGRGELDLDARVGRRIPVGDGVDVVRGDVGAVLGAQQVLGEDLQAVGEFLGAGDRVEAEDLVAVVSDLERVLRSERIHAVSHQLPAFSCHRRRAVSAILGHLNSTVVLLKSYRALSPSLLLPGACCHRVG